MFKQVRSEGFFVDIPGDDTVTITLGIGDGKRRFRFPSGVGEFKTRWTSVGGDASPQFEGCFYKETVRLQGPPAPEPETDWIELPDGDEMEVETGKIAWAYPMLTVWTKAEEVSEA